MPRTISYARLIAGFVLPHNVVELIRQRRERQRMIVDGARAEAFKRAVRERGRPAPAAYGWQEALSLLVGLGCDRKQVGDGSMPEASLRYSCRILEESLKERPLLGLHVGNFVGISLCHFTDFARRCDPRSTVVSIDPNLPHRGIRNPLEKTLSCLSHFGLQGNSMILTGYSLEKSVSNDGVNIAGYDAEASFAAEVSCENQLPLLAGLMPERFHFAVMDGNHEASYLARELACVHRLLRSEGILVLDDVDWSGIGEVYSGLDSQLFERLGTDGRVGIARKKAAHG